jgi:hypothetical protein
VLQSELRARSSRRPVLQAIHSPPADWCTSSWTSSRWIGYPGLNRSCALSGPPAAQTSCPLQSGNPGSRQPSPDGAERERRYATHLDPDSVLPLPASAGRTIGEMSVELISGLVSAPPGLPRVRLCHLFKLLADSFERSGDSHNLVVGLEGEDVGGEVV